MIVEKPEFLKQWIAKTLEPMCDAEPTKLARYVLALVRRSGPADELRATMLDSLAVFLHEQTVPFVERLLAAVRAGSYVPAGGAPADCRLVTLPTPLPSRRLVRLPISLADGPPSLSSPPPSDRAGSIRHNHAHSSRPTRPAVPGAAAGEEEAAATGHQVAVTAGDEAGCAPCDLRHRLNLALGRRFSPGLSDRADLPGVAVTVVPTYRPHQPADTADSARHNGSEVTGRPSPDYDVTQTTLSDHMNESAASSDDGPSPVVASGPFPACTSLRLGLVPAQLNQIMPLNEHFSQFGRVTNIQVALDGDPEAALVTFSSAWEAEVALAAPAMLAGHVVTIQQQADIEPERPHQLQVVLSTTGKLSRTVINREAVRQSTEQQASEEPPQGSQEEPRPADQDEPRQQTERQGSQEEPRPADQEEPRQQTERQGSQEKPPHPTERHGDQERRQDNRQAERHALSRRHGVDAVHRSQGLLAASATLQAKRKDQRKEALRLSAHLQRRETQLLADQLSQQRALLARLEAPGLRPHERAALLDTVGRLQKTIDVTGAALGAALQRPAGHASAQTQRASTPRPRPRPHSPLSHTEVQERRRQLLDLELELHQRQLAGADTAQLQHRLLDLRKLTRGRGRGRAARGTGRSSRGRVWTPSRLTSVDRRPAAVSKSAVDAFGMDTIPSHLKCADSADMEATDAAAASAASDRDSADEERSWRP